MSLGEHNWRQNANKQNIDPKCQANIPDQLEHNGHNKPPNSPPNHTHIHVDVIANLSANLDMMYKEMGGYNVKLQTLYDNMESKLVILRKEYEVIHKNCESLNSNMEILNNNVINLHNVHNDNIINIKSCILKQSENIEADRTKLRQALLQ